jgi:hypothetical protein
MKRLATAAAAAAAIMVLGSVSARADMSAYTGFGLNGLSNFTSSLQLASPFTNVGGTFGFNSLSSGTFARNGADFRTSFGLSGSVGGASLNGNFNSDFNRSDFHSSFSSQGFNSNFGSGSFNNSFNNSFPNSLPGY